MNATLNTVIDLWPQIKDVFSVPQNDREYNRLQKIVDDLVDQVQGNEKHKLTPLLDTLGSLIEVYEENTLQFNQVPAVDALKFLMQEHGLVQSDLKDIISQGVLSEVLNNKRKLNLNQIKLLAKRFHVSPLVFIE